MERTILWVRCTGFGDARSLTAYHFHFTASVRVVLPVRCTGGGAGAPAAKLFGEDPDQQVREDPLRFKQIVEAGGIPTTAGRPAVR
jgi:uncharacterized membrane protein